MTATKHEGVGADFAIGAGETLHPHLPRRCVTFPYPSSI